MVDSWEAFAEGQGFEFEHGPAAWIEGRHAFLAPRDLRSGEVLELDESEFGKAAAA